MAKHDPLCPGFKFQLILYMIILIKFKALRGTNMICVH